MSRPAPGQLVTIGAVAPLDIAVPVARAAVVVAVMVTGVALRYGFELVGGGGGGAGAEVVGGGGA